jgi:competence protein ComEC
MVIAWALMAAASAVQLPWRWCGVGAAPLLWGYVLIIGAPPSAVRAAAMATINFMAPVFYRKSDSLMAWTITFFAVHIFSPRMITDIGCRLSFAVMLALILAGEFVHSRFTGWKAAAIVSYAAWAGGVPIAAAVFSRVTPGGLLANLFLMPAAGASVWAGMMGVAASYVSETLAAHLNNLQALSVRFMVGVSVAVSRLPLANFEIEPLSFLEAIVWYLILFLPFALYFVYRRFRLF